MNVNRSNFEQALKHLEKILPDCAFVSIDLEFTGLGLERPSHLDTPTKRYLAAKEAAESFKPLQCGLTVFRRAPKDSYRDGSPKKPEDGAERDEVMLVWEAVPFNFQLFPRAVFFTPNAKYPIRERMMTMQASSVEFLMKHGFNFQECFDDGVSWLLPEDEASTRAELLAVNSSPAGRRKGKVADPAWGAEPAERQDMEKLRGKVVEWMKKVKSKAGSKQMIALAPYNLGKKLLYNVFEKHFPTIFMQVNLNCRTIGMEPHLSVEIMPSAEAAREKVEQVRFREYKSAIDRRVREAVGFRLVMDAVIAAGKPLVVHHGMLDTSKVISNFVGPLPDTLSGFKRVLLKSFPTVWDTRVMFSNAAESRPWLANLLNTERGRNISGLIDAMREPVRSAAVPPVWLQLYNASGDESAPRLRGEVADFSRYDEQNAEYFMHEAGFDSLETGRAFLYLLGMVSGKQVGVDDVLQAKYSHPVLKSYMNKIYMGSCGGYLDIALSQTADAGASPEEELAVEHNRNVWLDREDVLVISGMVDEREDQLLAPRDMPFSDYYKMAEKVVKSAKSVYHHKMSIMMPLERSFILIPQLPKAKQTGKTTVPLASNFSMPSDVQMTPVKASPKKPADGKDASGKDGDIAMDSADDVKPLSSNDSGDSKRKAEDAVQKNGDRDSNSDGSAANGSSVRPEEMSPEKVKHEIGLIRKEVEKLGLTVMTYGEALKVPLPKRMRIMI